MDYFWSWVEAKGSMEVTFESRAGYLYAAISGALTSGDVRAATQRVLDTAAEQGQTNVLVDVRQVQGTLTDTQRFRYMEFVVARVAALVPRTGAALRLAYLGHTPLIDPQRFGMTVTQNRGLRTLATESLDEALRWLGVT